MDAGAGWHVAAGAHRVVEYLLSPEIVRLPLTPAHCPGVLIWREKMVPVTDLAALLGGDEREAQARRHAVVLAYQMAPGQPLRYGAVLVDGAPYEVYVADDMACALPEGSEVVRHVACSCFTHDDRVIPILDVARLFDRPLPWAAAQLDGDAEAVAPPVDGPPAGRDSAVGG
ncbi:MAG: chemotaxis protein CheW [Gammaproteobacteria bacterium]|nr:chemotaxis protein CheW [Gammaproteobacteria bacterium]